MDQTKLEAVQNALSVLARFGITDGVLRYGANGIVAVPLTLSIMGKLTDDRISQNKMDQWVQLTNARQVANPKSITEHDLSDFRRIIQQVSRWVVLATIEDIIQLKPPSANSWESMQRGTENDEHVFDSYNWIIDRYVDPDMSSWATFSLHSEYRFLESSNTGDFPRSAILPISIDRNQLTAEIAKRAACPDNRQIDKLYTQIFNSAVNYLEQALYNSAATLFEFFLNMHPGFLSH